MKKTSQPSMDGFVPRRPDMAGRRVLGTAAHQASKRPAMRPSVGQATPSRRIQPTPVASGAGIKNDIAQSLQSIDNEVEEPPKKRRIFRRKAERTPPSRRRKIIKRVCIAIAILLLLAGGYFGWKVLSTSGKLLSGNFLDVFQHQRLKEDENGRTNVLIFGTSGWAMDGTGWDGALLTDSIMVVSMDQDDKDVYTVSLPRDLYYGTCTSTGKLNEVYWCAQQDGKSDKEAAIAFTEAAADITGLDIQYYVHANWNALVQGVDSVGGVDVKIEGTGGEGIYDVATGVRYKEGEVAHMDGQKALAFARARGSEGGYGLDGSNFARERNQQRLLAALQKKATSASVLANPVAVTGLIDTLGDNLRTNFQTGEVQALLDIAKGDTKITSLPLVDRPNDEPDLMDSTGNPVAGRGVYTEIRAYIKKSLLGDKTAVLDVLNGSGAAGLAQKKATELEDLGYTIQTIDNAPADITTKVQIYQLNESKTSVAKKLKDTYGVDIQTGAPEGYTPSEDTDFVLVFGPTES